MRNRILTGVLVGLAALAVGCATRQEWTEWNAHPTHFASGDHFGFSVRHREGADYRVSRADLQQARDEVWWGKAITVEQSAITEK
jgi:hypothetical protein